MAAGRYLIVGQGLAGTLLGYRLERAGAEVHYVDAPGQTAASAVAAGIINPITGRRFVRSWRIGELLPAARRCYTELAERLGQPLYYDLPLVRTLYNRGDENDWLARSADPGYADYLDDEPALGRLPELTRPAYAYAGVRHSARVDVGGLVTAYRARLVAEGRFTAAAFDYSTLLLPPGRPARYQGADYDRVVFCEGWRARRNPWFAYLPHGGNKGEVLSVTTDAPLLDRMFKHRVFLVPRTDRNDYWIGATSENRFPDDAPTAAGRRFLEQRLAEVLTIPFTVTDHRAAVRPTVRDRRMFLGTHPADGRLAIFNGLGTKGASLAPLGSDWLARHLLAGAPLPVEVDIRRFAPPG